MKEKKIILITLIVLGIFCSCGERVHKDRNEYGESFMPTNGIIFSDGIETDFLNFNSGSIATIGTAKEKAKLVTLDK